MVRNRRNPAGFETVKHAGVFDAHRHWVAREAFRVRNDQFVGRIAEGVPQRLDFRLSRTASSGGVGLVGEEDGVRRDGVSVEPPSAFHVGDEAVHDLPDVLDVQTRAVVGGIGRGGTEEFSNGLHATLLRLGVTLDHERSRTHAQNHAVAASVKGQGGLLDDVVRCCGSRGCETTGDPLPEVVAGDVVAADDDHTVHSVGVQPILRHAEGSGRRCACQVERGVRAAYAGVLRKLGMAHAEGLEEVAAVKSPLTVVAVRLGVFQSHLQPGEARGKHDPRSFTLDLRNLPVPNQTQAAFANLLDGGQGYARISQGQQTRSHSKLRADVPGENGFGVDAKLLSEIKGSFESSKLRYVSKHLGLVHVDRTVTSLDETDDVFVQQPLLVFVRHFTDARLASHELLKGVLVEDALHAGKAKGDTRYHVRVNVPARRGLKGRSGSNWSGLECRRCRDGGHRRPRGRRLTHPPVEVTCGHDRRPVKLGVNASLGGDSGHHALHLMSAQSKPVNKRHVAVTEGSGIVAVACDSITHVGLNGTIPCVVGIDAFGLNDRGCRGQRCTGARQRASTNAKRLQFRRGGRCPQRGCDAGFDGARLEPVLQGVGIQRWPLRRTTGKGQRTNGR